RPRGTRTGRCRRHAVNALPHALSQHHRRRSQPVPALLPPHPGADEASSLLVRPHIPSFRTYRTVRVHTCGALVSISPPGRGDDCMQSQPLRRRSQPVPSLLPPLPLEDEPPSLLVNPHIPSFRTSHTVRVYTCGALVSISPPRRVVHYVLSHHHRRRSQRVPALLPPHPGAD